MKTYSVKYNIISFFFSLDYSLLVAFCIYIYILIWDSRIGYSLQNWNCSTLGTAQNRGNFHCWFVFIFISFFWCAWLSSIRINATIGCHQINETIKLEHMQIETFDGWKKMSVFVANNFRINQTHRRRMQRIYIYIYICPENRNHDHVNGCVALCRPISRQSHDNRLYVYFCFTFISFVSMEFC